MEWLFNRNISSPIEDFDDYKVIGLLKNSLLIESIDFSTNTSSYGGARIKANDIIYKKYAPIFG